MDTTTQKTLKLWRAEDGSLRLATETACFLGVRPIWSSPLSRLGKFLALVDKQGEQVLMIPDPKVLDAESAAAVHAVLDQQYLSSRITRILSAKFDNGVTYWTVETHRGRRDFVMQQIHENAQWMSPTHVMLSDVDGNRFEIADTRALDATSRKLFGQVM